MGVFKKVLFSGLVAILASTAVYADNEWNDDMSSDKRDEYHHMMDKHHQMMQDLMSMLKSTMAILHDLNHKPSTVESEKLSEMMARIDDMMIDHNEMADKARKMHEERYKDIREKRQERMKDYMGK